MKNRPYQWIALGFVEKGHAMMNYEWNPERQYLFNSGLHVVNLKMSLMERISTHKHKCEVEEEANPHQCLSDFYMSKLGCSFPWDVQKQDICTGPSHVTHLRDLVTKMANKSSETRK